MCAACAAKTHSFFVARIGVARRDLIGKVTSSAGPQPKRMTTEAHEVIRSASTISLPLAAHHEGRNSSPVLTRQLLEKGNIDALAAIDAPGLKLLTEADRIGSGDVGDSTAGGCVGLRLQLVDLEFGDQFRGKANRQDRRLAPVVLPFHHRATRHC